MLVSVLYLARSLRGFGFSFLCLCFILLLQRATVTGRELKFVATVYRTGDRSPIETFPMNTYAENIWSQGYGQLTKEGMKQHYKLGQYLRRKYRQFLSPKYKRQEIYVLSTDVDRTIMSAQTNLAGLYRPSLSQKWSNYLHWQPIPVHTLPKDKDELLYYPTRDCPRFSTLVAETMNSDAFQHRLKNEMPFLNQIAPKIGYDMRDILNVKAMVLWNAYDTLLVQSIHRYQNPDWADKAKLEKMKSLLEFFISSAYGEPKRVEKARTQGGRLVKAILEEITKAATNADPRKMIMYSAHDMTLIALQSALDVYDKKLPPYAASHIFELYQETDGQYTVEMYYLTDIAKNPTPLTLPGCSQACPLDTFKGLVAPIIADDWQAECRET